MTAKKITKKCFLLANQTWLYYCNRRQDMLVQPVRTYFKIEVFEQY